MPKRQWTAKRVAAWIIEDGLDSALSAWGEKDWLWDPGELNPRTVSQVQDQIDKMTEPIIDRLTRVFEGTDADDLGRFMTRGTKDHERW